MGQSMKGLEKESGQKRKMWKSMRKATKNIMFCKDWVKRLGGIGTCGGDRIQEKCEGMGNGGETHHTREDLDQEKGT